MLIQVRQHAPADLSAWDRASRVDAVVARTMVHKRRVARSVDALVEFAAAGSCYCGVSWGKDSVVTADLVAEHTPRVPLVSIVGRPIDNPHNVLVRDEFMRRHPNAIYSEIEVWCRAGDNGEWHATGTMERGFAEAAERFGARHISGVRGEEAGARALRMRRWGISTANTCAPIGWWTGGDVFARLHARGLPVHPAYAMSLGGLLDRERLRVAWLTLRHGEGMGRAEWERRYYGWRLAEIRAHAISAQLAPTAPDDSV